MPSWLSEVDRANSYRLADGGRVAKSGPGTPMGEITRGGNGHRDTPILRKRKSARTCAVGLFPKGVAHCGAHDMAGNVWEWTSSWSDKNENSRGLRGGSWNFSDYFARAAFRDSYHPYDRFNDVGLRLVRVPRPPSLLGH